MTGVKSSNKRTGIRNNKAEKSFAPNVDMVAHHIWPGVCLFSDSSEICIPKGSEKASAMAIVNIPPMTASRECVPECRPTINPRVVIIPEVNPKLMPVLSWCFIARIITGFEILVYRQFKKRPPSPETGERVRGLETSYYRESPFKDNIFSLCV